MNQYGTLAVFLGNTLRTDGNPDYHDDRIAAEEYNSRNKVRLGLLDWLLPRSVLLDWARRQEQRKLEAALERLAALSPHLLDDIGMAAVDDVRKADDLEAQMAADLATVDPVLSLPIAQKRRAARVAAEKRAAATSPMAIAAE